jgi:ferritin
MLSPDIENAMNTQIAAELYSSHLYLAMSAYCEEQALPGFARWFKIQSDEEREHALKFVRHVVDRGGRVMLTGMDASMMIDGLYGMAVQHGDYASQVFLQWFVTEQVEEERTAAEIVQTLKTLGGEPAPLLMLDRELGSREG